MKNIKTLPLILSAILQIIAYLLYIGIFYSIIKGGVKWQELIYVVLILVIIQSTAIYLKKKYPNEDNLLNKPLTKPLSTKKRKILILILLVIIAITFLLLTTI